MEIRGRVALVTGANRGIGRAIVDRLLADGARRVYAAARTSGDGLPHPAEVPLLLDVTDRAPVAEVARECPDVDLPEMTMRWLLALALLGCAGQPRRFPLRDALWVDADRQPVASQPAKYVSGLYADGADQMLLRPLSQAFALPLEEEAVNVNSLDEVPDSAWFENRIGQRAMSPDEVARGACADAPPLDPARGPWTIVAAKPNGYNPGFFVKAPDGHRYLLKFDGPEQPQRATAADVIVSKLYHAAGLHTPCNEIVYFPEDLLRMDPAATRTDEVGEKVPMTRADVDRVLAAGLRRKDGWVRASASRFLPGVPLGPFRYEGTRDDDPNDVVPHEDRRELRGARLLAAWVAHFDAREQNTMDLWVDDGGRRYVRHYYLDFGDSFGSLWPWDPVSRRLGHSGYFDWGHVAVDLVTLGALPRPWRAARPGPHAGIFGYFAADPFVASRWRGGYPNPAFDRMTLRDALWMGRILARFTEEQIAAAVGAGRLHDPEAARWLTGTLVARRDRILGEYFAVGSPLDRFLLVRRTPGDAAQSLCFEDLAIARGVADPARVVYRVEALAGERLDRRMGWIQFRPDPAHPQRACILLPVGRTRPAQLAPAGAPDDDPLRYQIIEIANGPADALAPVSAVRLHLYDLGPARGFRLVGIERGPAARR